MAKLLYQGHGSLRLVTQEGKTIYIDPYTGDGYDRPADLILVTHQHPDHNRIDLPQHAQECRVIQNMDALKDGVYQQFDVAGVHIEAVEAYNKSHPKDECVGYIVTVDGKTVYFAGDTAKTEQMASFAERNLDYAFLPTDGIFTMNIPAAIECAELIKAKHTIPIHMAPGRRFDKHKAKKFVTESAMIIEPGTEVEL